MFDLVRQAMLDLAIEYEVFSEAVVFTQISPLETNLLEESLCRTRRLITAEEGGMSFGWGSEVISKVVENKRCRLQGIKRVAALDYPVPTTRVLEQHVLPSVEDIIRIALECLE